MALEDELLRQRHDRIAQIQQLGFQPYGHAFDYTHTVPQILEEYGHKTSEELSSPVHVRIAGRIQRIRRMGKAGFLHVLQNGKSLQIYVKKDAVSETVYKLYELLDIGDIIGVSGYLFRTKTGELSVHVDELFFLSKILLPLPEKWHGLEDVEIRYRQRYLDLISNVEVRDVFLTRSKIISSLRRQLDSPRLYRSGNAHDAAASGRRGGPSLCNASQHARHRLISAHRARAISEAPRRRRPRTRLRNQSQLPQRRHLNAPQPGIHHA